MAYNILLVDDDKVFREEFADCFDEYNIIAVKNGEACIDILSEANEIDMVILDIMMPGMNGIEILRKIRRQNSDLKVLMLTGNSTKEFAIQSLKAHATDYFEKPINIRNMRALLSELLINKDDSRCVIERVKQYIDRNYDKNITLVSAARTVSLSPKYLSRLFKQSCEQGFTEYRLSVIMEKAKAMLLETSYNICEVSSHMGYRNVESFVRIFKKLTGFSPSEYRKNVSSRGPAQTGNDEHSST